MVLTRVEPVIDPVDLGIRRRLWTREEYDRIAEAGIFGPDERLELIDGEVVVVSPPSEPHVAATSKAADAVRAAFGAGYYVRTQAPLAPNLSSEPEPDVAVVAGHPDDYDEHPTSALLVIEVGRSTLAFDRRIKASLYARASIADYWIANLIDRQLEVLRDPGELPDGRVGYRSRTILKPGDTISPLAKPDASIAVESLLPKAR